jgi:phenylpyruvate tautomerase PptA (4-oxalocrotonate tautomerase family)
MERASLRTVTFDHQVRKITDTAMRADLAQVGWRSWTSTGDAAPTTWWPTTSASTRGSSTRTCCLELELCDREPYNRIGQFWQMWRGADDDEVAAEAGPDAGGRGLMPIIDVEWVTDEPVAPDLPRALADGLGEIFGSAPGTTWVRFRTLPCEQYAENDVAVAPEPVFVHVLMSRQPAGEAAAALAEQVTRCVAGRIGAEPDRVHVLFAASGAGRIAFGGELRE